MILATGIDLVDLSRIRSLLDRRGERFLSRILRPAERDYCISRTDPVPSLAARFAAKEAVMKCLGTGLTQGVTFRDIEVVRDARGAVGVRLHGQTADRARGLGITRIHVSLTHTAGQAAAVAVAEGP